MENVVYKGLWYLEESQIHFNVLELRAVRLVWSLIQSKGESILFTQIFNSEESR